jgi:hypothetical protein
MDMYARTGHTSVHVIEDIILGVGYLEVYQTTKATVMISIIEEKKEELIQC